MSNERESSEYNLEPASSDSDASNHPPTHVGPIGAVAAPMIDLSRDNVPCLNCGYNLRGLKCEGVCPECGVAVTRSLQGNLLIFSSREYVASLHRGVIMILISVVLGLLVTLALIAISFSVGFGGGASNSLLDLLIRVLGASLFLIAVLSLAGWWLFSAPDPAIMGNDKGDTPRKIVRIAVIVGAVSSLSSMITEFAATGPEMDMIDSGIQVVAFIVGIAQFFASMLYVRWLGPRLPDPSITTTARLYMWLLPLIYVVGACVLVGPLIAIVMYYFFLNRVRIHLRSIRQKQELEGLAGVA